MWKTIEKIKTQEEITAEDLFEQFINELDRMNRLEMMTVTRATTTTDTKIQLRVKLITMFQEKTESAKKSFIKRMKDIKIEEKSKIIKNPKPIKLIKDVEILIGYFQYELKKMLKKDIKTDTMATFGEAVRDLKIIQTKIFGKTISKVPKKIKNSVDSLQKLRIQVEKNGYEINEEIKSELNTTKIDGNINEMLAEVIAQEKAAKEFNNSTTARYDHVNTQVDSDIKITDLNDAEIRGLFQKRYPQQVQMDIKYMRAKLAEEEK